MVKNISDDLSLRSIYTFDLKVMFFELCRRSIMCDCGELSVTPSILHIYVLIIKEIKMQN